MSVAELIKETIVVGRVGPYGVQVGNEWYGVNKPIEPKDFKIGVTYDVLLKVGKKKYISQIIGQAPEAETKATPVTGRGTSNDVTRDTTKSSTETKPTEAYWKDKNDSMKIGGLFHDVAQVTAALIMVNGATTVEAALETFESVLDGIVAIREQD